MKIIALLIILSGIAFADVLYVGESESYSGLEQAAADANPGDTILFRSETYQGGEHVSNLQGSEDNRIYIIAENEVIISGGNNAWQLSDAAYLYIKGFIFENQNGNGLNIDDGGDYTTPTHNITFAECTFRDINASGNNDLLKMSGVDNFIIKNCIFENGADGGSGLDMVGCHWGEISECRFENMGSNAIQAKGGTQNITISRNYFKNCGNRTLNLGGSTGLQFFRPIDAGFEAADLNVYSNIIIGSEAPIAYVGSVNVRVVNNTLINQGKWTLRILQETVDEDRFASCGNNFFMNNIIYYNSESPETNIGPNTLPETFIFSNNLWYKYSDPTREPYIPVVDETIITGLDPMFEDLSDEDFSLKETSPAIEYISGFEEPETDFYGNQFLEERSIGAVESGNPVSVRNYITNTHIELYQNYPNPCSYETTILYRLNKAGNIKIAVYDILGNEIETLEDGICSEGKHQIILNTERMNAGAYFYKLEQGNHSAIRTMIISK